MTAQKSPPEPLPAAADEAPPANPQAEPEFGAIIGPEHPLPVLGDLGMATRLASTFAAMVLLLLVLMAWAWWYATPGL